MKGQKLEKAGGGQSNPTQPRTLLHTASMCVPGCLPSHSLFTLCPCPLINMGGPPAAHTLHVIGGLWTSSGFSARIKRTWPPSPLCASPPASLPIRRERFILWFNYSSVRKIIRLLWFLFRFEKFVLLPCLLSLDIEWKKVFFIITGFLYYNICSILE